MFTGIITQKAQIQGRIESNGDLQIQIKLQNGFLDDCVIGDSISVSGVCLTVVELGEIRFSVDVSAETLSKTTLGQLQDGHEVNLEAALRVNDRLGGHLVSGHIDACAKLTDVRPNKSSRQLQFEYPDALAKYIAVKGSVCVDGVSLTVNELSEMNVHPAWFRVNVIPHTLEVTTLGQLKTGDSVNIEVDMISRYLERLQSV
ncbi:MAG: riboflavin synthase [Lysobacterales bacterium]|jgi:riboflavin synthase